ncbi:MAG: hypothetical protein ACOYIR_08345 [Christensenellales bacterium]|jgi:hypothetical protein
MRIVLRRLFAVLLAALIIVSPICSFAAPAEPVQQAPTRSMTRSERSLRSILAEEKDSIRATLFTEFVNSRLKYVTARSLAKAVGSKWIGYVDIVEELHNGEHLGYILDKAVVQYGYTCLPKETVSATLKIGEVAETIKYSGEALFSFSNIALDDTAIEDSVSLRVELNNSHYDIELSEYYPNDTLKKDDALAAMAATYAEYASASDTLQLVDHAVLKLKSYISHFDSQKRSYIWELYLVHGDKLPAQAMLIRYYPSSKAVRAYARTLRDYF